MSPPASLVIHSGRGVYLKWLLKSPLPQAALPRWNVVQREIVSRLADFGSDPKAGSRLTTIRRSGQPDFRRQFDPVKSGGFFMVRKAASLSVQGQRGGVYQKKAWGCTSPTFLKLFCFLWFVPSNRLPACRYRKIRGDDSAPPRNGGSYWSRVAARCTVPLSGPRGSLSSVFIPAGRLGKDAPQRRE